MEQLFDMVRRMPLTRLQIDSIIQAYFQQLKEERVDGMLLPADLTSDEQGELVKGLEEDYQLTKHQNLTTGVAAIREDKSHVSGRFKAKGEAEQLQAIFKAQGQTAPTLNTPDFAYAIRGVREANEELARLEVARMKGASLNELMPQGRFAGYTSKTTFSNGSTVLLSSVVDEFVKHKLIEDWRKATEAENRQKLADFVGFLHERYGRKEIPIGEINYTDLAAYKENLHKRITPRKGRLSASSMAKYMGNVSALLNFAVARDYIAASPYRSELFKIKKKKGPKDGYRDFTSDEIRKLFGSADYNKAEDFRQTSNWWLPLLGLYTGARRAELVALTPQDIRTEDGVKYINIRSTDERDIKNGWSERKVPIHNKLVELGFLDLVHQKRRSKFLFPDLMETCERPAPAYSNRFARLLDRLAMADPKLVFHSFRHTFITHMRVARVSKDDRIAITGHADEDVHDHYGQRPPVKVLGPEMQKLDYGIDWASLLKPAQ
jgi:integrase